MRAIVYDQTGGPEVLRLAEIADPLPGPDEVLVRVRATAHTRADLLQRRGAYPPPAGASPVLGLEVAGEVLQAAGPWQPGDRVMAVGTGGGYAELATVPSGMCMPIPQAHTFEQAAAILESLLTAWLNLFHLGRQQPGDVVLILAGASGVGSAAIQLARERGARVIATAGTPEKRALCEELGAELAIDYHTRSFAEATMAHTGGHGADIVLDFVGARYWNDNLAAMAPGGRLMLIGSLSGSRGELDISAIMAKRLVVTGTTLRRTPLDLKIALTQALAQFALPLFEDDRLRPVIDSVLPLAEAAAAHQRMEANANLGKIILRIS